MRARLLRERELTLQSAIDICRAAEVPETQLREMGDEKNVHALKDKKQNYKQRVAKPEPVIRCKYCGKDHIKGADHCLAYGKFCSKCNQKNHYAAVCKNGRQPATHYSKHMKPRNRQIHQIEESKEDSDDNFFMYSLDSGKEDDWTVQLLVNDAKPINFKIDTGAQCNVMSLKACQDANIKMKQLTRSNSKLVSYSGNAAKACGKVQTSVRHKDQYFLMEIQIVDDNVQPILGLKSSLDMNLVNRVYTVNRNQSTESVEGLLNEYDHLFHGIGCLPGKYDIKVDHRVKPVVAPPRRIPHTLKDKVREELQRMESMKIISKVETPTRWVSPIVVVKKPSGKVRICLDPRELNKAILREHYPLKTVEEVAASLKQAKHFTTMDAASGFYQIQLTEESSWLTTFNTPFGRYKFERLPFGISSAPEVFQRAMSQVFENQLCEVIVDDILIWADSEQEHLEKLWQILKRANDVGLRFNKDKCKVNKKEVEYVGHIFSAEGVKPSDDKIKAILTIPTPENKKELQRFMGMINYLGKFIPNLSARNQPLRQLLENEVNWHWDEAQERAFNDLKEAITSTPTLKYFDVSDDITLSVDASSFGLGACIMQREQPVAYASRALNTAERNYAQIETEMLGIVYGLQKFNEYVYGKTVLVETDHKPLESLFKKPLSSAPPRLQRMMLKVQQHDIVVKYKAGKELYIADTLSRSKGFEQVGNLEEQFEVHVIDTIPVSHEKVTLFQSETKKDPLLMKLKDTVLQGWPTNKRHLDIELTPYWNFRDEISIVDGLLLKRDRIITPEKLRPEMLKILHSSHLGQEKCNKERSQHCFGQGLPHS